MFAKAFRVKSNTAIKGSDRRKLRADVTAAFPSLGTDRVSELIPGKEELNVVKLYAHKGDAVTVYMTGGNPILFELEKNLYPTVYTLWSYPDLLPAFTTWPLVLEKLVGGADLMLPGVVVPPTGLPQVQQGDLCAIALVGNRAPVAVGVAAMSTTQMLASGLKGKGFSVLHTYQDHLWKSGDKSSPPAIAPLAVNPTDSNEEKVDLGLHGNLSSLTLEGEEEKRKVHHPEASEDTSSGALSQGSLDGKPLQEQMDDLLHQCFLHALKSRVKKADLPLLTSTLLGSHMFSCCPEGQQLDIKKSSYKKLSKFLQHMQQEQIVQVKELSKGVESIVAVDWRHPRKGSTLEGSEVRRIVIDYAKKNSLVDADNRNLVKLDPVLCDCILEKNEQHSVMKLPWDCLLTRCLQNMQPAYQVTFPGQEPILKKGKLSPIDITLAQKAYNKKVTVVRNLETYGLDPCSVAATLQQRCQASTIVSPAPGAKDSLQVQIQGNQIHHLGQLLLGGNIKTKAFTNCPDTLISMCRTDQKPTPHLPCHVLSASPCCILLI
ncbi:eukaryotic translation initiation factor 2D isoform X5 [Onychomys torridus]|uniref:eukaryotic translation initiation factor 2D isoform X5 n=1 Tax=Onychomys torridus TaxID=38674 RepID=UPI00167F3C2B|nr:eukaryotic translation initiation factor 2D isoform X5 [Onychomys torridus]